MKLKLTGGERFFLVVLALPLVGFSLAGFVGAFPGWVGVALLLSTLRWDRLRLRRNVGGNDRITRFLLALALIGFSLSGRVGPIPGWVGFEVLVTALIAWSPVYALLNYNPQRRSTE
jgi:hypothetical protein